VTARDVGIGLTLAGVDVLDYAVQEARIVWGRGDLFEQPDVASITLLLDVDRAGWDVNALPFDVGADIVVTAPSTGLPAEHVYVGRLADMVLQFDDDTGHAHVRITGDDHLAQLAHVYVGDEPWPVEPAQLRAIRIVALLPPALSGFEVEFGALPERFWDVRDRDVDRQPALSLLQDVARSTDTGLYLVAGEAGETPLKYLFHGLSLDHPGRVFELDVDTYRVVDAAGVAEVTISTGYLDAGVDYHKGLAQLVTGAQVDYWDDVGLVDVSVLYANAGAEDLHGTRREALRTQLVDQVNAELLAARTLLRGVPSWRTETLTWDADDGGPPTAAALTLQRFLRSRDRVGLGVLITDLPSWVPDESAYVFVEGGEFRYLADRADRGDGNVGRWVVTVAVVPSAGVGLGITYTQALAEHPAMTYENIDPAVRYIDALAVGV
jgi:hypothetical protein